MVTLDLRAEVEICPFSACAMHPAIIIIIIIIIIMQFLTRHVSVG